MEKCLLLGETSLAPIVAGNLKTRFKLNFLNRIDFLDEQTYFKHLENNEIIVALLNPQDVDFKIQAFFNALESQKITVKQFVFVTFAGIDNEIQGKDLNNEPEAHQLANMSRYAIKIIDEMEIPYLVIRLGQLTDGDNELKMVSEGDPLVHPQTAKDTAARQIATMVGNPRYNGKSLALVNRGRK